MRIALWIGILVSILSVSAKLHARDFPSEESLEKSSWNSVYENAAGQPVSALVRFNGQNGTYDTPFGRGRLSNIEYGVDTNSNPDQAFFQITGKWSFQGRQGSFLFASRGPDKFAGSWNGDIGSGKWTGTNMFGPWKKDPNNDRYFCEFRYPDKQDPTTINVQVVLWYPHDPDRTGYYYFANKENKIWGRCVCPADSNFDPEVMQWSVLSGGDWDELPRGDCPAPSNGNPELAAVSQIPEPPI